MPDTFHDLIRDTLTFLKDPHQPRQTIFASVEDSAYLKGKDKEMLMVQKEVPPVLPQQSTIKEKIITEQTAPTPSAKSEIPSEPSPIKKALQRIVPGLKLVDHVPDDWEAKRIASAWKEKIPDAEVLLLVCDPAAETLDFVKGLAKAIDQNLAKAKILMAERLEREKRWDIFLDKNPMRLIVASDGIQKLPELMRFYKAIPAKAQFFLNHIPLHVLSAASIYKSLEHKALLWKTLCQLLKK